MNRINLLQFPALRWLLVNRWPQFILRIITLAGFILAILAGLWGTPVGSRNFSIVAIWIAWWAFLILLAVPALGRGWCNICPIPLVGEWFQQGNILGPGTKPTPRGLNKPWPKKLRNIWLQNTFFLLLALTSTVILTKPSITAIAITALFVLALGSSIVYERRSFCRYVCPVSGFIGLYSQVSPVEVRVVDTAVCASHKEKTCYTGNEEGYGCPWNVYPAGLIKNTNCGTCMECLRTCPYDNMAVNIRPVGTDLFVTRERKLDEAFKAFIMLGSAIVYSIVMLGHWGSIKTAAYSIGTLPWMGYAMVILSFILLILPGGFYLAVRIGAPKEISSKGLRKLFTAQSYSLIPLGLAAWIAFSVSFVFANFSYVWIAASDPFGWGWNILGTAGLEWTPYLTQAVPLLQIFVLIVGLAATIFTTKKISRETTQFKVSNPIVVYSTLITVGLLWILAG